MQPDQQITIKPEHIVRPSDGPVILPPKREKDRDKKTLVIDLDETLVHSSFKPIEKSKQADMILQVEIENNLCPVYVLVRPGTEWFLHRMSLFYELVIFTASLSKYAKPLMENLDPQGLCGPLLTRDHCTFYNGVFVKDMSRLGRQLEDVILLDNSPISYLFQPECGMPIVNWYDDQSDQELIHYIPILEWLAYVDDVRKYLPKMVDNNQLDYKWAVSVIRNAQFKFTSFQEMESRSRPKSVSNKGTSRSRHSERASERAMSHDRRKWQPHQS